nr:MAG TPA: Head Tail Connector Protein [Caudoviricetes sp.]
MLPDGLLDIVKNRLDITWSDDSTDKKLTLMISNGIAELDALSGIKNNYLVEGKAQSLLFNYVMYDMSNCLDDFKKNYQSDIVSFINRAKVKNYVEN